MSSDRQTRRRGRRRRREGRRREASLGQDEAEGLIGQYALIGFTYVAADGETVTSQVQRHGTIISADPMNGIELRCEGAHAGETIKLPPHLQVFQFANPDQYKSRTTGEVVDNSDVMAT